MEFYAAFKPVRNKLKKCNRDDIVGKCRSLLHSVDPRNPQDLSKAPPWSVLLLLKWAFLYAEKRGEVISPSAFLRLVQVVKDLEPHAGLPQQDLPILAFMRGVFNQQAALQRDVNGPDFARQDLMFGELSPTHGIRQQFAEVTGMELADALDLSLVMTSAFLKGKRDVGEGYLAELHSSFSADSVESFIRLVSQDKNEMRGFLQTHANTKHSAMEYRELSPFATCPLIRDKGSLQLIYGPALYDAMTHLVYRTLRRRLGHDFAELFGSVFEAYLENGLVLYGRHYESESRLRRLLGDGKVVDYLLCEDQANVWIEAKGVELTLPGMVAQDPALVVRQIEGSVIKGIVQAGGAASRLKGSGLDGRKGLRNYVLVVTHEDLFLGNGELFVHSIANSSEALRGVLGGGMIKAQDIFCLSAREYDALISCLAASGDSMTVVLDAISANHQEFLQVGQHLSMRYADIGSPDYLKERRSHLMNRIMRRLEGRAPA